MSICKSKWPPSLDLKLYKKMLKAFFTETDELMAFNNI
jgi:hypothetical protein